MRRGNESTDDVESTGLPKYYKPTPENLVHLKFQEEWRKPPASHNLTKMVGGWGKKKNGEVLLSRLVFPISYKIFSRLNPTILREPMVSPAMVSNCNEYNLAWFKFRETQGLLKL